MGFAKILFSRGNPSTPFKGEMSQPPRIRLNYNQLIGVPGAVRWGVTDNTIGMAFKGGDPHSVSMGRSSIGAWPAKVTFGTAEMHGTYALVKVKVMYTDGQFADRQLIVNVPYQYQDVDTFERK